MNCPKCGAINSSDSKFCIQCGSLLGSSISVQPVQQESQNNEYIMYQQSVTQPTDSMQINNNAQSMRNNANQRLSITNYFFMLLAVLLQPFTAMKEESEKFSTFRNSAILTIIVSIIATLLSTIQAILSVVIVKSYHWSKGYTTKWVWENVKEINFIKLIGKNILIYLGIILVIAVVYYIASLMVKKETNFSKLLGVSALSIVPIFLCAFALSPLVSLVYAPLGMGITILGSIYSFIILYETMNQEVSLTGNKKYYFHLICLSMIGMTAYYLLMKVMVGTVTGL